MVWSMRDLDNKGLGQNNVLCNSLEVKLLMVILLLQAPQYPLHHKNRSLVSCWLLTLKPHWLGFLFVALLCRLFLVTSSLSPHLARFLVRPIGHPCFCFAGSWIVGLVIGGAESKGANVAVGFSGWSLWKVLTIFWRCMTAKEDS